VKLFESPALVFAVLMSVSAPSCSNDTKTQTEREVARIAEQYVAVHYPKFDTVKNPPIVEDKGSTWEVDYKLPTDVIGGTPVIVIEKNTLKVLRSYHTQ
jgi:hypothetical protein